MSVDYGKDQAFTITPDPATRSLDVLVDGVSVGAVTSYTFNDVTAAHTIAATFAVNPAVEDHLQPLQLFGGGEHQRQVLRRGVERR